MNDNGGPVDKVVPFLVRHLVKKKNFFFLLRAKRKEEKHTKTELKILRLVLTAEIGENTSLATTDTPSAMTRSSSMRRLFERINVCVRSRYPVEAGWSMLNVRGIKFITRCTNALPFSKIMT